jgi:2-alkenal reductase
MDIVKNAIEKKVNRRLILLALFVLLAITACSRSAPPQDTATAVPTVDTNEIAKVVLAEVEARLNQQREIADTATPVPTVDTNAIAQAVLAEVEAQLPQQTPTPVPTIDTNEIAEAVLAEVESRLAQEREEVQVGYNNAAAAIGAEGTQDALTQVYQRANPAVVFIAIPSVGSGSGFVYSETGYIVTNNHVVEGGRTFEVVFASGERLDADLVGTDADSDLAVIKVDQLPEGVEPLPLADPESIQVGQFVVAIGSPFGEQGSMSLGIVSALGRSLRSQSESTFGGSYSLPQVIQTDAPINPGNSGGPLLNLVGEVVGVNSSIATRTGTNSGVGFSIPVAAVKQIVPSLIDNGAYVYPFMGVSFDDEVSLSEQSTYGLPQTQGAYVVGVTSDGPGAQAGLTPANPNTGRGGDLVVKIDDQEINDFSDLNSYLVFHTTVGQTIEITVLRDGEPVVLSLTLGARP